MGDVDEPARVRVEADGTVTVYSGQSPHGQGHKTTLAQLAADELGVRLESVRVVTGDTRSTPFSLYGTGGSRSASIAGGAVTTASRQVREKITRMAAALLEASPDDIEIVEGMVGVRGVPAQAMPLAMLATAAYAAPFTFPEDVRGPLEATVEFRSGDAGWWTGAVHCCEVEVDPSTGAVRITRYLVVEDCGRMINPAVVEGQIIGGVAQGIGAVFLERSAYDGDGQFLAGTFMDYLLPTATDVPRIEIEHMQMESGNPFNIRGVGEGGMIAAPAAITNALDDALAPHGSRLVEQYLPPARVLALAGGAS
jgi:carbon-monoxide dehydrogenase large subunit